MSSCATASWPLAQARCKGCDPPYAMQRQAMIRGPCQHTFTDRSDNDEKEDNVSIGMWYVPHQKAQSMLLSSAEHPQPLSYRTGKHRAKAWHQPTEYKGYSAGRGRDATLQIIPHTHDVSVAYDEALFFIAYQAFIIHVCSAFDVANNFSDVTRFTVLHQQFVRALVAIAGWCCVARDGTHIALFSFDSFLR